MAPWLDASREGPDRQRAAERATGVGLAAGGSVERLRRLIRRLALAIGLCIALGLPLGVTGLLVHHQQRELDLGARVAADVLAAGLLAPALETAAAAPARTALDRAAAGLDGLLAAGERDGGAWFLVLSGADGRELLRRGSPGAAGILRQTARADLPGRLGSVALSAALWPLLVTGLLTLLASTLAAAGLGFLLHRLPQRALDRSVAELRAGVAQVERHTAETAYAYEELKRQHRIVEETTQELMKARDEALSADRAKSAFLATMSHELRTPLNAIIGFSEVLTLGVFGPIGNERYRDYCQAIGESGRHLLAVINDVLDLSKIEAGKLQLRHEEIRLESLIASCCTVVRGKIDESGLTLELAPPDAPLPPLWADSVKLRQIVLNLLSNAVKFTPAGGRLRIETHADPLRGIGFTIADSGIGMTAADVALALKPFQQIDNSHTRRYEGTGLGLPLAKALVEQHGGTLTIESAPGRGTSVTVFLPDHTRAPDGPAESGQGTLDLEGLAPLGRRSA